MQSFLYNQKAIQQITIEKKTAKWEGVLCILLLMVAALLAFKADVADAALIGCGVLILDLISLVLISQKTNKLERIIQNIEKTEVTVMSEMVKIVYVQNVSEKDTETYVEIPRSEIREIRTATPNVKKGEYHTVTIIAKNGIYKLCVENPEALKQTIETICVD